MTWLFLKRSTHRNMAFTHWIHTVSLQCLTEVSWAVYWQLSSLLWYTHTLLNVLQVIFKTTWDSKFPQTGSQQLHGDTKWRATYKRTLPPNTKLLTRSKVNPSRSAARRGGNFHLLLATEDGGFHFTPNNPPTKTWDGFKKDLQYSNWLSIGMNMGRYRSHVPMIYRTS